MLGLLKKSSGRNVYSEPVHERCAGLFGGRLYSVERK
jgi:hypothetical protein